MANPNPVQTDTLKGNWYKPLHSYRVAKLPTSVKLPERPVNVDQIFKSLTTDEKREIIAIGLHLRGLLSDQQMQDLGFGEETAADTTVQ